MHLICIYLEYLYICVKKDMKSKLCIFSLLLLPFAVSAQNISAITAPGIENTTTHFVKNTTGLVQVLDSVIYFDYNGADWDSTDKQCIVSRHWGTQGLPNEWAIYSYNETENRWDYKYYEHYTYHSDTAEIIHEWLIKPYNAYTMSLESDSLQYYEYMNYVSSQFGQLLKKVIYMYYDYNTCNFTSGLRYDIDIIHDTLYSCYHMKMFDAATGIWSNYARMLFSYDANNYLQNQMIQVWSPSDNAFINSTQSYYSYQNGLEIQYVNQNWNGTIWVNQNKNNFTYTPSGLLSTELEQQWDNGNSVWVNDKLRTYTYTGGLETEYIYQIWNTGTDSWDNTSRLVYTYDVNGNRLTQKSYSWDGAAWENSSRYTWTYNSNNQVTLELYEVWNSGLTTWVNSTKDMYTYDGNFNLTQEVFQNWSGSSWVNYDKEDYTYDANDNKILFVYSTWNSGLSSWDLIDKTQYFYSEFNATSISDLTNNAVVAFPNPTNGYITINPKDKSYTDIIISDAAGRIVLEKPMNETGSCINLKQYGSGLYNITLRDYSGNLNSTQVIVQ